MTQADINVAKCVLELVESLNDSLAKAHGRSVNIKELGTTNLLDFLCQIAPNGIRFTFDEALVAKN